MANERDDPRKVVLARRARFITAALAGMSIACGKEKAPQPCLEVTNDPDATVTAAPQACLSTEPTTTPTTPPAWIDPPEAGTPDAGAPDAGTAKRQPARSPSRPTACLSVAPPQHPTPPTPPPTPHGFDYRDDDFGDPK